MEKKRRSIVKLPDTVEIPGRMPIPEDLSIKGPRALHTKPRRRARGEVLGDEEFCAQAFRATCDACSQEDRPILIHPTESDEGPYGHVCFTCAPGWLQTTFQEGRVNRIVERLRAKLGSSEKAAALRRRLVANPEETNAVFLKLFPKVSA